MSDTTAKKIPLAPSAWYLCHTKPRQESHAEARLLEQGYATYLPRLMRWQRKGGHWSRQAQVMFPRYLFVRPTHHEQAVAPMRNTPGISTLVRFGSQLALWPDARLQALRRLCDEVARALPAQPFEPGMHVVFADGPLKGAHGIVSSVAQERVNVMLSLLGGMQAVQVPAAALAAA